MTANLKTYFPFFTNHPDLIYLDTAASAQKPKQVIDAMHHFYLNDYSNVHRGIYDLAERATTEFEEARAKVARFLNAQTNEIVFTRGTTEGINFIATAWASKFLKKGDAVVISALEHHSNLLPWQVVCNQTGAELRIIKLLPDGNLDMAHAEISIKQGVKLVAIAHTSNVLGTQIDVKKIGQMAHAVGAKILVDAAQSVVHMPIDVKELDCDFLAFSGHKLYGPSGIGVLFIKAALHDAVEPCQYGGGMVFNADYHHATWQPAPRKFEAGTPPITEAIGLGAAIDFLNALDRVAIEKHVSSLCRQAIEGLQQLPKIKLLGPVNDLKKQGNLITFIVDGLHAHDVAAYLNQFNICVRAGHNCAQPLANQLGLDAAVRASFGMYNTEAEVDTLVDKLSQI